MKYKKLHLWDISPEEAIEIQKTLRGKVIIENKFKDIKYIAGADVSYCRESSSGYAAVIIMTFPDLEIVEEKWVNKKIDFPYIPGLLSFRESPILLNAFEKLKREPDLIIFDGQGIAHPRGMGIASHIGIILDKPTIGCAKSRLFGRYDEPGKKAGDFSYIYSPSPTLTLTLSQRERERGIRGEEIKEIIGAVLRTKSNTKPVFVSIGHKIDLPTSINFILRCTKGYRTPEPTRIAHNLVSRFKPKV